MLRQRSRAIQDSVQRTDPRSVWPRSQPGNESRRGGGDALAGLWAKGTCQGTLSRSHDPARQRARPEPRRGRDRRASRHQCVECGESLHVHGGERSARPALPPPALALRRSAPSPVRHLSRPVRVRKVRSRPYPLLTRCPAAVTVARLRSRAGAVPGAGSPPPGHCRPPSSGASAGSPASRSLAMPP